MMNVKKKKVNIKFFEFLKYVENSKKFTSI